MRSGCSHILGEPLLLSLRNESLLETACLRFETSELLGLRQGLLLRLLHLLLEKGSKARKLIGWQTV